MTDLQPSSVTNILEAFIAFGIVAGVVVALADTRAFPLAFGILIVAFFYWFLRHSNVLSSLGNTVQQAGGVVSGVPGSHVPFTPGG